MMVDSVVKHEDQYRRVAVPCRKSRASEMPALHEPAVRRSFSAAIIALMLPLLLLQVPVAASEHEGRTESCTSVFVDLNGDGRKETVAISVDYIGPDGPQYKLLIADTFHFGPANANPEGSFSIVDIDSGDRFLEIAVFDYGPSDDLTTEFFFYDGHRIRPMGVVQGFASVNGRRRIFTRTRGAILHTWFYPDEYILTRSHLLRHVDKPLYEMNTRVTILQDISIRRFRRANSPRIALKAGETAIIDVTDNREWCHIRTASGRSGWFSVNEGFPTGEGDDSYFQFEEVFDGLSNAD